MRVVMSVAATTVPSPGWYPDPRSSDRLRWWDGSAWTEHLTDAPRRETEPAAQTNEPRTPAFVLDLAEVVTEDDPIEFSWDDTVEAYAVEAYAVEPDAEPEPEPAPAPSAGTFAFRARALSSDRAPRPAAEPARPAIVYGSPLDTIFSPLPASAVAVPAEPAPEPSALTAPAAPAPPRVRSAIPARAMKGSAALVVLAAAAAGMTNLLRDEPASDKLPPATVAISAQDKQCLKEWNTTTSATAVDLRVTLGQFTGAYAHVGRVTPLPGTLMAPDSCALTVHDPATDTDAVFVAGVQDQVGYIDVTAYPRALKHYATPKSARAANVLISADGTIAAG